jgi:uncharacterized membrane protein AbrB (regulator of aidB expression)
MNQHKRHAAVSFRISLLWLIGGATAIGACVSVFEGWIPMAFRMRGAGQLFALGLIMVSHFDVDVLSVKEETSTLKQISIN